MYWTLQFIWQETLNWLSWQTRWDFSYEHSHWWWICHMFRHAVLLLWSLKLNLFHVACVAEKIIYSFLSTRICVRFESRVYFGQNWKSHFTVRHAFRGAWPLSSLWNFPAMQLFISTWWRYKILYRINAREMLTTYWFRETALCIIL